MRGTIDSLYFILIILSKLTKHILFDFWKYLFCKLFICPIKGHDWRFIGGGWIFVSKHSFKCDRCNKRTNEIDQPYSKI